MDRVVREWTLHEEIGRGGMGVVYRATHEILKGSWAVKVMLPHLADDPEYRSRFMSEASVLADVQHVNIISVQTPFQEKGQLYLPMELLTGRSLAEALRVEKGPWSVMAATDVLRQVAAGLACVHSQRPAVLHRDIKPENIQITDEGTVKIFDFGLARSDDEAAVTAAGKTIGTPDYMAPELLRGKPATRQSDVYALGLVMYRLLAGRLPWDIPHSAGATPLARVMALLETHGRGLPDVSTFAPHLPQELACLTMACLAADPADRPADGAQVLELMNGPASGGDTVHSNGLDELEIDGLDVSWGLGASGRFDDSHGDPDSPEIPRPLDEEEERIRRRLARKRGRGAGGSVGGVFAALLVFGLLGLTVWAAIDAPGFVAAFRQAAALVGVDLPLDAGTGRAGDVPGDVAGDTVGGLQGSDAVGEAGRAGKAPGATGVTARDAGAAVAGAAFAGAAFAGVDNAPPAAVDVDAVASVADQAPVPVSVDDGRINASAVGIQWVPVQARMFTMGSGGPRDVTGPAHEVFVPAFEMARHEVTVAQYRSCVEAGECTPPRWSGCIGYQRIPGGATKKIKKYEEKVLTFVPQDFRGDDQPVVCVDWDQASAFAAWVGGRLPTEAEWESAASAAGGAFPWGDAPANCKYAVMATTSTSSADGEEWGCGTEATAPVCSRKKGNTPSGICDLSGNAQEWVQDVFVKGYAGAPVDGSARRDDAIERRVCRGGAWYSFREGVRSVFRAGHPRDSHNIGIGFRPVRPASETAGGGAGGGL